MAGKEARGVEAADADLFRGRPWVLTSPDAELESWIQKIGARLVMLDAAEHDRLVALVSHLPQLLSTALASALANEPAALRIAGPAAIDLTRLALSPYDIWRDIFATNTAEIDAALASFIARLQQMRADLRRRSRHGRRNSTRPPSPRAPSGIHPDMRPDMLRVASEDESRPRRDTKAGKGETMEDDNKLSYFFLGLGLGVVAGVLFAPKSGAETRDFLASKANEGADLAKRRAEEMREAAVETYDAAYPRSSVTKRIWRPPSKRADRPIASRQPSRRLSRVGHSSGGQARSRRAPRRCSDLARRQPWQTIWTSKLCSSTMTGFVIIAAIALIIQAGFLFGIYKAARGMSDNVQRLMPKIESTLETSRQTIEEGRKHVADITAKALVLNDNVQRLMPKIESIIETSRLTIEDGRKQIADISSKASDIVETTRLQVHRIDGFVEDATGRAKLQMDRAEMVIDDDHGPRAAHLRSGGSGNRQAGAASPGRGRRHPHGRFIPDAGTSRSSRAPPRTKRCLFSSAAIAVKVRQSLREAQEAGSFFDTPYPRTSPHTGRAVIS